MKKTASQTPNPALEPLEILVGNWDMELSNASFLPGSVDTIRGHALFEWLQGGAFLVMYMGNAPHGAPDAIWLISRDETTPSYIVFYYDTRKVSRVYEMSFSQGIWKMWRNTADFSQRFEGKVNGEGDIITAHWEKSYDGSTWEHDFDVTYKKVG
jgi:hypothetical protein